MQRVIFTPGMQILQSEKEVKERKQRVMSVRDLMHEGEKMTGAGKFEEAIKCYDEALQKEKTLLPLVTGKAQAQIGAGKLQNAVKTYERAMKMSPNNATVLFNRGVLYQKLGQFQQAVKDYTRAAEIMPRNFKAHYNCSLALKKLGHYDAALSEINSALEIDPRSADALYNKANIFVKQREYLKALDSLEEAHKIAPSDKGIKAKLAAVREEHKAWLAMEPERRKKREEKYSDKSQLHGYFNRVKKPAVKPEMATTIKVFKLTGNDGGDVSSNDPPSTTGSSTTK
mmetsp:Transcript_11871/g.16433  ORF Transcript_11871/g.16433 Transcript_11871/m.16433 type:complete len:285 (-) Transcript_11871:130-984(-)